jgi:hypothetical protein
MTAIGRRIAGRRPYLTGEWLKDYRVVEEILHALIDANDDGLPPKHAPVHMTLMGSAESDAAGTADGVISGADPTPIALDSEADPGVPEAGASSAGHVHPVSTALKALGSVSTETRNGKQVAYVSNPELLSVLQEILVRLDRLVELRERRV